MYVTNLDCRPVWILPEWMRAPYEADTTKETDTTEQAAAYTPKDPINIDSDDDNDNYEKYQDDINADTKMMVRSKTKTSCSLGHQGSRYVRNLRSIHYSPRIAAMTTMNITLNQAMTIVRRRINQEGPPRAPYGPPRKLTGQATDCPPRKRRRQFWLRLVQPATSPSSWRPMAWMKSLRSRN